MTFDPAQLEHFPNQPGVYLMKDKEGTVIYVGKAKQLKQRVKQYFLKNDTRPMIPLLIEQTCFIDTLIVPSEKEALLLENTLIKKHQPKFNAVLKDDKTFISLMININHPWPRLRLVRCKGPASDKGLYFGPYTSAYSAKQTCELLQRLFPLRQCSDEELARRTKPCILYAIKRCLAPCVQRCSKEEYGILVRKIVQFLKGEDQEIIRNLREEMRAASDRLDFERAASLLETLRHLEHVLTSSSLVDKIDGKNTDALGLYRQGSDSLLIQLLFREGKLIGSHSYSFPFCAEEDETLLSSFLLQHYQAQEFPEEILIPLTLSSTPLITDILSQRAHKKIRLFCPVKGDKSALVMMANTNAQSLLVQRKASKELKEETLLDLQTLLKLNSYPSTIACFDTSHHRGSDTVASLVTFVDGEKETKLTRLFKLIRTKEGDDYGALREVLTRYLKRAKEEEHLPNLIIVDGGKGQLHCAEEVLKQLDIASVDLIAITKEQGRHDKGMTAERIFLCGHADPIHLNIRSHLLFFLQNIRDEAHRKAISYHAKRSRTRHLTCKLDSLSGIGPIKKKRLLQHFGSLEQIRKASSQELKRVKGITDKDVRTLQDL